MRCHGTLQHSARDSHVGNKGGTGVDAGPTSRVGRDYFCQAKGMFAQNRVGIVDHR